MDMTNEYNTPLSQNEQPLFKKWAGEKIKDKYDYDLQGFWLADRKFGSDGHGTDEFKKPNHPTFSNESKYSNEKTPGGVWDQNDEGTYRFTPSEFNNNMMSKEDRRDYWQYAEKESGAILND